MTFIDAITSAMAEEMRRNPEVFVFGEDVGAYGGVFKATKGLQEEFGEDRCFDTPITENLIIGLAAGASLVGMRPVAEIQFADFLTCGWDQLVQQLAKMRYRTGGASTCPATVRVCCGAEIGGGLYHSQTNEAWLVHCPGLVVMAPATAYDAKGMLRAALRGEDPVVFLEHKKLYRSIKEELPDDDYVVDWKKAEVRREGKDITIIAYQLMMHRSLQAAEELAEEGIDAEVIDLRTLLPLDRETICESVKKTGRALVVHESPKTGGVGGEVIATINEGCFEYLEAPPTRVCSPDVPPVPFAEPMEHFVIPQLDDIKNAVREVMDWA